MRQDNNKNKKQQQQKATRKSEKLNANASPSA